MTDTMVVEVTSVMKPTRASFAEAFGTRFGRVAKMVSVPVGTDIIPGAPSRSEWCVAWEWETTVWAVVIWPKRSAAARRKAQGGVR
jgi:hypothetical protein